MSVLLVALSYVKNIEKMMACFLIILTERQCLLTFVGYMQMFFIISVNMSTVGIIEMTLKK